MDGFEFNKLLGAILGAFLLILLVNEVGNLVINPKMPAKSVIGIETANAATDNKAGTTEEKDPPLAVLLAAADAGKGAKVAKKCISCHTFDKGGKNKVGPNLYDVTGRDMAKGAGFSYSGAMSAMTEKWTYVNLDKFLKDPKKYIKGTKMAFRGLKKATERADVIAYMRQQAENPPPFPKQ